MPHRLSSEDYPGLYRAADQAAQEAQSKYLWSVGSYLCIMIMGAGLAIYADVSRPSAIVAAVVFLAGLGLALLQAFRRFDQIWYNGRAVAESVKTRTWRYMMKAGPYNPSGGEAVASNIFCKDLVAILRENAGLAPFLPADASTQDAISPEMGRVRRLSVPDRLDFFRYARIDEQRAWYAKRQRQNRQRGVRWFVILITTHAVAIALLLIQIGYPNLGYLPTELFVVAATAALTWLHVKRFHDNATAYALAAHEITLIREQSASVSDEEDLSEFVMSAESAFSREHTQWIARRSD